MMKIRGACMNLKSVSISLLLSSLSGPALAWTMSADFDSGALGTKVDRGGDGFSGAGGGGLYSNETAIKGNSAKLHIEEGKTGFGMWGGEFLFPEKVYRGGNLWYQVHVYFPEDFDHYSYGEGNRLKFLRIQTFTTDNKNRGYLDLYIDQKGSANPFKWIYEGEQRWSNVGNQSDMIVKDRWESYQMQVTLDVTPVNDGGEAEVRIWKNGKLLSHITDRATLQAETDYSSRALLFTYWNGGAPKTQSMFVDEITITTDAPNSFDVQGNSRLPSLIGNPPAKINDFSVE
jgi:hypothetical protein